VGLPGLAIGSALAEGARGVTIVPPPSAPLRGGVAAADAPAVLAGVLLPALPADLLDSPAAGLIGLPAGPAMLLGLAAVTPQQFQRLDWLGWPSKQAWRATAGVSLVVAVTGYAYCRADADRRRAQQGRLARQAPAGRGRRPQVASAERPDEGL
jgi:hypothetical protein